jgi:hypothetical protein
MNWCFWAWIGLATVRSNQQKKRTIRKHEFIPAPAKISIAQQMPPQMAMKQGIKNPCWDDGIAHHFFL